MNLQVYSEKHSNRLEYILEIICTNLLGIEYTYSNNTNSIDTTRATLNYSTKNIINSIQIIPHSLLFEEDIKPQKIKIEEEYHFFKTSNKKLSYDILASSFYMISRYEEYLPSQLDTHKRFQAEESIAFKNNFLSKAVVNRWIFELKKELQIQFPTLKFKTQEYSYLSTIDIDNAYAYKAKGIYRLVGGLFKSILKHDFDDLKARLSYVFLNKKDPFDVFTDIENLHKKHQIKSIFFFLVGKNGPFDKNINIKSLHYKKLIRHISCHSDIGIHPSYQSNTDIKKLESEIKSLECTIGKPIENSRQHFLKLNFPSTYQNLIKLRIQSDYTMGYASQIGFRAGICTPFKWFDLSCDSKTNLMVYPFQIMDGSLNDYLKLNSEEALRAIKEINNEVRKHNGLFVTLWHNESLSEMRQWKAWKNVYENVLSISKI